MSKSTYTYEELSHELGIPVGTLRIWKMQGRIEAVKFGSRVKFQREYVEELKRRGVPPKNGRL